MVKAYQIAEYHLCLIILTQKGEIPDTGFDVPQDIATPKSYSPKKMESVKLIERDNRLSDIVSVLSCVYHMI